MASAIFGQKGITVARGLLKAPDVGLTEIRGGGLSFTVTIPLVWEDYGYYYGLKTTNSMTTNNAMVFPYPATDPIRDIRLTNSSRDKQLTLVLQTGTLQSDTFKFIREILIKLGE